MTFMKLPTYFVNLSLAGILLASPAMGLAGEDISAPINQNYPMPELTRESTTDESTQQRNFTAPFELVAIDYCYRGSSVDPTTGEVVDLYVLCAEGEMDQNLDIG
jgi:hypothetical protein